VVMEEELGTMEGSKFAWRQFVIAHTVV
jgi:hypothetical protein